MRCFDLQEEKKNSEGCVGVTINQDIPMLKSEIGSLDNNNCKCLRKMCMLTWSNELIIHGERKSTKLESAHLSGIVYKG